MCDSRGAFIPKGKVASPCCGFHSRCFLTGLQAWRHCNSDFAHCQGELKNTIIPLICCVANKESTSSKHGNVGRYIKYMKSFHGIDMVEKRKPSSLVVMLELRPPFLHSFRLHFRKYVFNMLRRMWEKQVQHSRYMAIRLKKIMLYLAPI